MHQNLVQLTSKYNQLRLIRPKYAKILVAFSWVLNYALLLIKGVNGVYPEQMVKLGRLVKFPLELWSADCTCAVKPNHVYMKWTSDLINSLMLMEEFIRMGADPLFLKFSVSVAIKNNGTNGVQMFYRNRSCWI